MKPQSITGAWDQYRQALRNRVTPVTWQTWLEPLEFLQEESGTLSISTPSEFHLRWVSEKYGTLLSQVATDIFDASEVQLEARPADINLSASEILEEEPRAEPVLVEPGIEPSSAPKYSFENFIVGPSNRFAYAAAMAVAEQPGKHYNPLFIYGPAGLGKTHLLHSVAAQSREINPGLVMRYVTSEDFFNDFVDGIRRKRMDEFKNRYRRIDILLLDDVQFFEGKEQILEEFFHTFNTLHQAGSQLVITSDRHPRHLSTLEDRLRSRFEWGLLTDIQPPDVETRLAILHKNAEFAPREVPESVLEFIASHVPNNIRELEGALTRITAYAALTQQEITLDMATDVLQDLIPTASQRTLHPEEIIGATAAATGLSPADLIGPSRRQPLVRARQTAMYLCRELTDLSLPKIGRAFGGRDHTTVMHALDRVKALMVEDKATFDQVTALSQNLRGG
ncbi:MAG: chromosomal replication initiator protein DnaA [Acidimicrobiia bacterium]|nr:chromosomal replication initiator protein DnaA [Acidimicrobiia bacterium]NNF87743.1 chromosomal replication initiator protein DnaA [Acidimicrobiia bacterium]NNL48192.1 chromosomal replication initiator protein DnaA [Acidimicrobiia bacterium]